MLTAAAVPVHPHAGTPDTPSADPDAVADAVATFRRCAMQLRAAGDDSRARAADAKANALEYLGQDRFTSWIKDPQDPARTVTFYVGTPRPLDFTELNVPLFVSSTRLTRTVPDDPDDMPKAQTLWALDSGGFTELANHGTWRAHPDSFGGTVTRLVDECGAPPTWCAPQDWMCEPWIITGGVHRGKEYPGTGFDVRTHQEFTVDNYLWLTREFYFIPWAPVLQGWTLEDYLTCIRMYEDAGVDLNAAPVVGLGSVCRREGTTEAEAIIHAIRAAGIERLHGFGVKTTGLARYGRYLHSADSQAWSYGARKRGIRLPGCTHAGPDCRNCPAWMLAWRERVLQAIRHAPAPSGAQGVLF